ncbi:substrate-binding domain-containing protein, partial [[Clostridium] symbiosum]
MRQPGGEPCVGGQSGRRPGGGAHPGRAGPPAHRLCRRGQRLHVHHRPPAGLSGRAARSEHPPREDDQTFAGRDYSFSSGVEAARRLLARPERPTALFCISDVLALGAVQAARELGLRVPEDLSVVGFDDVEYAVMGHPRLTTVRQPCYELGRTAGELLLTQIQGGPRGRAVYLPHTLIERDSTAR